MNSIMLKVAAECAMVMMVGNDLGAPAYMVEYTAAKLGVEMILSMILETP